MNLQLALHTSTSDHDLCWSWIMRDYRSTVQLQNEVHLGSGVIR